MIRAFALVAALALPSAGLAQPEIAASDQDRLDAYASHLGTAMIQAFHGGSAADLATLTTALSGAPVSGDITGDWQCRTIKIGGITALTVYSRFACRITEDGEGGYLFEKLTGSQLTRGTIVSRDGALVYLGVGYIRGNDPVSYTEFHDGIRPTDGGQVTADVGLFEYVSPSRARLLLPDPTLESDFDVLELTR